MSPKETQAPTPEDLTLPSSVWSRNGAVAFEVAPEVITAALTNIIKETSENQEPRFTREEVQKAVEEYLKAPATRG